MKANPSKGNSTIVYLPTHLKLSVIEGVRHPKFSYEQAAAGSRGSGGRLNLLYSAVEVVPEVAQQGLLVPD